MTMANVKTVNVTNMFPVVPMLHSTSISAAACLACRQIARPRSQILNPLMAEVILSQPWIEKVEAYFEFQQLRATWKTEILAGVTTFITMAYIVFVNPSILKDAGMPVAAVTVATCLSSAFACILMGVFARYPIALAPGMGLNAYFTYTVVVGMGVPWQTALGAVFVSGVAFFALTLLGVRQWIVAAIPRELYSAIAAGIGLFLAFIGLQNAGIVKADPATFVTMGNLSDPNAALALAGILLIGVLEAWKVRGSILLGILGTALLAFFAGLVTWQPRPYSWSDLSGTMLQLDVRGALEIGCSTSCSYSCLSICSITSELWWPSASEPV